MNNEKKYKRKKQVTDRLNFNACSKHGSSRNHNGGKCVQKTRKPTRRRVQRLKRPPGQKELQTTFDTCTVEESGVNLNTSGYTGGGKAAADAVGLDA